MVTLKTTMAISFLSAPSLSLIAKTNALQENVRTKDIWSDKAQRSLRKRLLASRPTFDQAAVLSHEDKLRAQLWARIAREFGVSQQDVRGALAGDARKQ